MPLGQAHTFQGGCAFTQPFRLRHAHNFKPKGHIVQHRAVGQQGKILKDHAEAALPHAPQVAGAHGGNVLIVHQHFAGAGHDQAIEAAQQG